MPNKLPFHLALITGASSGIGEALSRKLAKQGISLILCGRNLSKLEALAKELRSLVEVEIATAELASRLERKKIIEIIRRRAPDLVINNAGYGLYGEAIAHETEALLDLFEVDAAAVAELSVEAAKTLSTRGIKGAIMNISSAAAFLNFPGFAAYSASKAFVNQFSQSLDYEFSPRHIRVLTACPGLVATDFRRRASGKSSESTSFSMSAEYAAEQIIKQLSIGKRLNIFSGRYRLGIFFVKYLLPTALVSRFLSWYMKKHF